MQLRQQLRDELDGQLRTLADARLHADEAKLARRRLEVLNRAQQVFTCPVHADGQAQCLHLSGEVSDELANHRRFGPGEFLRQQRNEVVDVEQRPGNPLTNLLPGFVGCGIYQGLHAAQFIAHDFWPAPRLHERRGRRILRAQVGGLSRRPQESAVATWQFDVQLFQQALDEPLPAATREAAEHLLPLLFGVGDEMLDRWFVFGSEVGNRVDLLVLDDGCCEIHARFDARASRTDEFVRDACKLAAALDCCLFSAELHEVLQPTPASMLDALKRSAAWHYAADPAAFLGSLKNSP